MFVVHQDCGGFGAVLCGRVVLSCFDFVAS